MRKTWSRMSASGTHVRRLQKKSALTSTMWARPQFATTPIVPTSCQPSMERGIRQRPLSRCCSSCHFMSRAPVARGMRRQSLNPAVALNAGGAPARKSFIGRRSRRTGCKGCSRFRRFSNCNMFGPSWIFPKGARCQRTQTVEAERRGSNTVI